MGLDLNIRFRRIGAVPDVNGYYDDNDIQKMYDFSFQGYTEFQVVANWIGEDRECQWITIEGENRKSLMEAIDEELCFRHCRSTLKGDFPYWLIGTNFYGLEDFYNLLWKAEATIEYGWVLEIECD